MTELAGKRRATRIPSPERATAAAALEVTFEDDPRVVKEAATEDYSIHVMPRTWRSGRLSLMMAWGGMFSAMFWLYIAATVAAAVGTTNAVIGIVLTCLTKGAMNFVFTRYAIRTGTSVALFSRRLFGYFGSILAPLIFAATATYYGVFEGSIVAVALQRYFGAGNIKLWYLVVVVYSIPLILGGVRTWLDKLNGILLPIYLAGLIALIAVASSKHTARINLPNPHLALDAPGWLWAFTVYMGVYILMMYTMDFARFGKPKDENFHGLLTFGPIFYFATYLGTGLVGIFLTATVPGILGSSGGITETGIVDAIISTLGVTGMLLIFVSQTRINTANLYLASTNLESFVSRVAMLKLPRIVWAVVSGGVVYLLMLTDVLSYLLRALNWQGVFVVAWVAIALTHIAMFRYEDNTPETRPGRLRAFTPAVGVWVVISVAGILLTENGGTFGSTWSAPLVFVAGALGYALVGRFDVSLRRRSSDPRDELDNQWDARVRCHVCEKSYTAVEIDRDPRENDAAICSACASASVAFYRAALSDSSQRAAQ